VPQFPVIELYLAAVAGLCVLLRHAGATRRSAGFYWLVHAFWAGWLALLVFTRKSNVDVDWPFPFGDGNDWVASARLVFSMVVLGHVPFIVVPLDGPHPSHRRHPAGFEVDPHGTGHKLAGVYSKVVWTPDEEAPSLRDEPLSIAEQALIAHWREFRPRTVASLTKAGTLQQTARQTLWDAMTIELNAVADGATVDEARELTRDLLYAPDE
jgi:hypothetical protein